MRESNAAFCNGEIKKGASRVARETTNDDRATLLMGRRIRDGKALMIIVGRIMGGGTR